MLNIGNPTVQRDYEHMNTLTSLCQEGHAYEHQNTLVQDKA